jgi:filamentous hemagglutinin family protein
MNRQRPTPVASTIRTLKCTLLASTLLGLAASAAHAAPALPTGGAVVAGKASIGAPSNGALAISQSSKTAIINWNGFSIGQGGTVQINNGAGATLNRVTGASLSSIDGLLSATGSVYLINPNGVIIGKSGVINTGGGFVASTLDPGDSGFLAGGALTFTGASTAAVINLGKVGALGGNVALIASTVDNQGSIAAPNGTVGLAAGQQVTLKDSDNDGAGLFSVQLGGAGASVTNTGLITTANAELRAEQGNIYALAGNIGGVIRATGVNNQGGHIWLVAEAGTTTVGGTLDAQGANGAPGQIETSGQAVVVDTTTIDAHGGQWLLDPQNIEITAAGAATISTALATSNVIEQTSMAAVAGAGDITLDPGAAIGWSSGHSLTLQAFNNLNIDGVIAPTGAGTLNLIAGNALNINAPITVSGAGVVNLTYNPAAATNLSFGLGPAGFAGSLSFTDAPGSGQALAINGQAYTLLYKLAESGSTGPDSGLDDIAGIDSNATAAGGVTGTGQPAGDTAFYALAKNVNGTGTTFTSALAGAGPTTFTGVFEGLGHTVTGLTITDTANTYVGLFGGSSGSLRDVGVVGGSVVGASTIGYTGDLVGLNFGDVTGAYATGAVNGAFLVGGLAGGNVGGPSISAIIIDVYATGAVTGLNAADRGVGGLVGYNDSGGGTVSITDAYATGAVNGGGSSSTNVGGLVGWNTSAGGVASLTDVYATGAVNAAQGDVGGLVGKNQSSGGAASITNAYATGAVSGATGAAASAPIGGLVGTNFAKVAAGFTTATASITNAYATGSVSGGGTAAPIGGLVGWNESTNNGAASVTDAYATGLVNDPVSTLIGGVVGKNTASTETNAYWDKQTSGLATDAGGATGLTTAQFQGGAAAVGSAFAGGANGLYPYLTDFYPNGVQAISGFAYGPGGAAAKQAQVALYDGGSVVGGAPLSTGANGYFYTIAPAGTFAAGEAIGAALELSGASAVSGLSYAEGLTFNVASGLISEATTAASLSALAAGLNATFGSANFAALTTTLANAPLQIAAAGAFTVDQTISSAGSVQIEAGGALTIAASKSVSSTATGDAVILATTGNFINDSGAAAVSAANGAWLVYSASPTGDVFDNLNSNNTAIWSTGVGGGVSAAGDRYVFASLPTLTVTSTSASKTYGVDASSQIQSDFTISEAVAGAFLGSVPVTLTGAPSLASAGAVGTASVLGGPYAITVSAGSLSQSGYVFAFVNSGILTVTPEAITITAAANSKAYDNATSASAAPTVTSGTLYDLGSATLSEAYATDNAGTGLTLTPTALIPDASNYVVTLTSTNTGIITPEAITITATANSKTYNDSTGASATPTVTSGTLYDAAGSTLTESYTTANAGTGLTLTPTASIPDAGNYAVTLTSANIGTITPEAITITATANSKTYDNATGASATPTVTNGTLYDAAGSSLAEAYATANAGTGLTLTPTASIPDAGNYAVTLTPANVGTITPEAITITAAANSKTYDDSIGASATPTVTSGVLYDLAGSTLAEAYATANAGTGLTLTPTASILDAGNYKVTLTSVNTGIITPEAITITAAANSRTYDNATDASATPTVTSGVLYDLASSTLAEAYATANAGTGLTLTPTASILDAGNYKVTLTSVNTGIITPEAITITAAANSKTYNDSTDAAAAPTVTSGTLYDAAGSTLAEAYATTDAGTGLTLTPTAVIPDAGNYKVTLASVNTGIITPEAITITAAANSRTYDNATDASATPTVTTGVLYDLASSTLAEAYTTANAGTGLTLAPTASILDAGNYKVTLTSVNTGIITPEAITITAAANNKTYNDSTDAAAAPTVTSGTLYDAAGSTLAEAYATADAGTGLTLNPTAVIPDAGNYKVTLASVNTGIITPEAITITAAANSKTYDNATDAAAAPTVTSGTLYDLAGSTLAEAYATTDAGTGLSLNPTAVIPDAGNYKVTLTSVTTGIITPEAITITAAANSKTYDNAISAAAAPTVTSGTLYDLASSTLAEAYTTADAGAGLTLNPTAVIPDAANYKVTLASANVGTITPEAITITAAANSKTYNDSTDAAAAPTVTSGTLYDAAGSTLAEAYATADAGAGLTLNPTASIPDAGNYKVTLASANVGTITPEAITITAAANSKTYNDSTDAAAAPTVTSGTLYDAAGSTLAEAYATADAGAGLTLNPTAFIPDAGNYKVTLTSVNTGVITPEAITITAAANSKTYNDSTDAAAAPTVTSGTLYDAAGSTLAEAYATADAGAGLTLNPTAFIPDAGNYKVTLTSVNTGVITPEAITITAAANSRTYDTTTGAAATPTVTSGTLYDAGGSALAESYTTANAGTGLALVPTASIPDAGNYKVTLASANVGTITPEAITVTAAANSKTYDDSTVASATPTVTSGTLYDLASSTLAEAYASANAGVGLALVPTVSIPDSGNYAVTLDTAHTGTITPEAITITAVANSKTYDSTTGAAAAPTVTSGLLYDLSSATLAEIYATANAGAGLTLTPTVAIPDASNYAVTLASVNSGTITPEAITITATGNAKIYDSTTSAAAAPIVTSGVLYDAGASTLAETYAAAEAGTGLTLTPTAAIPDAGNYAVTLASVNTGVITPAANPGGLAGTTADQGGFNTTSPDVSPASGAPYSPSMNPQSTTSSDAACDAGSSCPKTNVPYPANLVVGPGIRFVPGL